MAKKRINGKGTVWFVPSEKRYRAQYPVGGKRRTLHPYLHPKARLKDRLLSSDFSENVGKTHLLRLTIQLNRGILLLIVL